MANTSAASPGSGVPVEKVVYVLNDDAAVREYSQVDLGQVARVLWQRRWWIVALTALATSLGVVYALLSTPYYRAEAVLLPRNSGTGLGLSTQLSQFSGLANLAGINVGSGDKQEPLGVMRSKGFSRRFIVQNNLLATLADNSDFRGMGGGKEAAEQPDIRRMVYHFTESVMNVTEDRKSGLVTVAVTWKDPDVAADWANKLVSQINHEMRQQALDESRDNIKYLSDQMKRTDLVAIQQSIGRVLEAEIQKLTLAQGSHEYAFRVIDLAEAPVQRESPKRTLIVMMSAVVGLIFAVLAALIADPLMRLIDAVREPRPRPGS